MFRHSPKIVSTEVFEGVSPKGFLKAAESGRFDIVSRYITENQHMKSVLDIQNSSGQAAIHFAAERGDLDMLKALITAGAEVNARDSSDATPLHKAAKHGKRDIVRALLEVDEIEVDIKHIQQGTALEIALHGEDVEIIDMLVKFEAHLVSYEHLLNNAATQRARDYLKKNKGKLIAIASAQNKRESGGSESESEDSYRVMHRRHYC